MDSQWHILDNMHYIGVSAPWWHIPTGRVYPFQNLITVPASSWYIPNILTTEASGAEESTMRALSPVELLFSVANEVTGSISLYIHSS